MGTPGEEITPDIRLPRGEELPGELAGMKGSKLHNYLGRSGGRDSLLQGAVLPLAFGSHLSLELP